MTMLEKAIEHANAEVEAQLGGGHNLTVRDVVIATLKAIRSLDDATLAEAKFIRMTRRDAEWNVAKLWLVTIDSILEEQT